MFVSRVLQCNGIGKMKMGCRLFKPSLKQTTEDKKTQQTNTDRQTQAHASIVRQTNPMAKFMRRLHSTPFAFY